MSLPEQPKQPEGDQRDLLESLPEAGDHAVKVPYCDDLAESYVIQPPIIPTPEKASPDERVLASARPSMREGGEPPNALTLLSPYLDQLIGSELSIGTVVDVVRGVDEILEKLAIHEGKELMPLNRMVIEQALPDPLADPEAFALEVTTILGELFVAVQALSTMAGLSKDLGKLHHQAAEHSAKTGYWLLDNRLANISASTAVASLIVFFGWQPTGDMSHAAFGDHLMNVPSNFLHAFLVVCAIGGALKGLGAVKAGIAAGWATAVDSGPSEEMAQQRRMLDETFAKAGKQTLPVIHTLSDAIETLEKHVIRLHGCVADAMARQGSTEPLRVAQEAIASAEYLQLISSHFCKRLVHDITVLAVTPASKDIWDRLNEPHERLTEGLHHVSAFIGAIFEVLRSPFRPESLREKKAAAEGAEPAQDEKAEGSKRNDPPRKASEVSSEQSEEQAQPMGLIPWCASWIQWGWSGLSSLIYHGVSMFSGANKATSDFAENVIIPSKDSLHMTIELAEMLVGALPGSTKKGSGPGGQMLVNLVEVVGTLEKGRQGEFGEMAGAAAAKTFYALFVKTIPFMIEAAKMAGKDALTPEQLEAMAAEKRGTAHKYWHHCLNVAGMVRNFVAAIPGTLTSAALFLTEPIQEILPSSFQPITWTRRWLRDWSLSSEERTVRNLESKHPELQALHDKGSMVAATAVLKDYLLLLEKPDKVTAKRLELGVEYFQAVRAAEVLKEEAKEDKLRDTLRSVDSRLLTLAGGQTDSILRFGQSIYEFLAQKISGKNTVERLAEKLSADPPEQLHGQIFIAGVEPDGSLIIIDRDGKIPLFKEKPLVVSNTKPSPDSISNSPSLAAQKILLTTKPMLGDEHAHGLKGRVLRDFLAKAISNYDGDEPIYPRVAMEADRARCIVGAAICGMQRLTFKQSQALMKAHELCSNKPEGTDYLTAVRILLDGDFSFGDIFGARDKITDRVEPRLPGILPYGLLGNRKVDPGLISWLKEEVGFS